MRFLRIAAGVMSYFVASVFGKKKKLLRVASQYYGHLLLEGAMVIDMISQLTQIERRQLVVSFHHHASNKFLVEQTKLKIRALRVPVNSFWAHVSDGQRFLTETLGIKFRALVDQSDFNDVLSHRSCMTLRGEYPFKLGESEREYLHKKLVFTKEPYLVFANRSTEYKKWREGDDMHAFRNFDCANLSAALSLASLPYSHVRVGVGSSSSLDGYLDARSSISRNPKLDFLTQLGASAYVGADSGPLWLFLLRNVPAALVNMIPFKESCPTDPSRLLVIPKLLYSNEKGRMLTLSEMCQTPVANARRSQNYRDLELVPRENDLADIESLLLDWKNVLEGDLEEIRRIETFNVNLRRRLEIEDLPSISPAFVRRNPHLISDLGPEKAFLSSV